jgi:hypothetical protein
MRSVEDSRAPSLILFAAFSLGLHAGSFGVLSRCRPQQQFALEPSSKTLVGTTFDVDPQFAFAAREETGGPGETQAAKAPAAPNGVVKRPRLGAGSGSQMPPPSSGPEPLYGAVGERSATDLATTFTRAFAQAASGDSVWSAAPFGAAGTAIVTLELDDTGHLAGTSIAGSPTIALRRGIERTLALLGPRALTARSAVTKLRIRAQVTRDAVHDGLHGDVFALSGGSLSGDIGTAFFALPPALGPGRRVDVELRLLP